MGDTIRTWLIAAAVVFVMWVIMHPARSVPDAWCVNYGIPSGTEC